MAPLSAETPEPEEPESRYCKECKLAFTGGDQEKLLCSSCKNLRTKLWRRLGAWDTFKQLDAKDRELFFKKNAGTSDWPTIQSRLVETLTRVRVSESRSETGGSYLPASVLLTQGFTQDVIDACSDTEDNPALGGDNVPPQGSLGVQHRGGENCPRGGLEPGEAGDHGQENAYLEASSG